jgi:hypothetical protein
MRTGLVAWPGRRSTVSASRSPPRARPRASREDHDLRRRSPARVPADCRRSPAEVCSRTTNQQIPWQAETLARPEYSSRSRRSDHVLTSHADPGVGQPSGLRVVHLVRHGAGRPPPRQGRRPYRRRRCAPHTDVEPVAWGRPSAGGVGHSTSRHDLASRRDITGRYRHRVQRSRLDHLAK